MGKRATDRRAAASRPSLVGAKLVDLLALGGDRLFVASGLGTAARAARRGQGGKLSFKLPAEP